MAAFGQDTQESAWMRFLHRISTDKTLRTLSKVLSAKGLHTVYETVDTATQLRQEHGLFTSTDHISSNLEEMIFDAFIEDDDEDLHMLSLRLDSNPSFAVGCVFWRDMERDDMEEWIEADSLSSDIVKDITNDTTHKWEIVRRLVHHTPQNPKQAVFDDWIKIELVVTHRDHYGHRIGTLLLALALLYASTQRSNPHGHAEHVVLHAAGGEENKAAVKLYRRLGFNVAPDGMFKKPCKNMFILPHIVATINAMDWEGTLMRPPSHQATNTSEKSAN